MASVPSRPGLPSPLLSFFCPLGSCSCFLRHLFLQSQETALWRLPWPLDFCLLTQDIQGRLSPDSWAKPSAVAGAVFLVRDFSAGSRCCRLHSLLFPRFLLSFLPFWGPNSFWTQVLPADLCFCGLGWAGSRPSWRKSAGRHHLQAENPWRRP